MKTLNEVEPEDEDYIGVPRPEVLKGLLELSSSKNPDTDYYTTNTQLSPKSHAIIRTLKDEANKRKYTELEGFIVKDKYGHRFKVKSTAYLNFVCGF